MNTIGKCLRAGPDHDLFQDIIRLDASYFPRPWTEENWRSLNWSQHTLMAWTSDAGLVGFALFATPDETAHLLKILIVPEQRGGREASLFWQELMRELRAWPFQSVYLEVEETNKRAQRFYEKMGFLTLRSVKSFYSDGQGARIMQLTL